MREIKFRFYWQHSASGHVIHQDYTLADIMSGKPYDDMSDNALLKKYVRLAEAQYTGLKDKNGREIYEGDIARDEEEGSYFVQWDEKYGRWSISTPEVECCDDLSDWLADSEVIGNRWEHLGLLEGS